MSLWLPSLLDWRGRRHVRQRRGFWWCCAEGSRAGSAVDGGSLPGSAPSCCDSEWWPDYPSGSPNYPDLTATISGSCCTGFQDINHSFAMTRTINGGTGKPQWDFTWTLNLTGFPPFNDCRNGSMTNSGILLCSDGQWRLNLANPATIPPPTVIVMTLLSCSPFHATAAVPDSFWGAQTCSNTSFLEITE